MDNTMTNSASHVNMKVTSIPGIKQIRRKLDYGHTYQQRDINFYNVVKEFRARFRTSDGTSGMDLYDWTSQIHQDGLAEMTIEFLEQDCRGKTYWPDDPEAFHYSALLQYSKHSDLIKANMLLLFFKINRQKRAKWISTVDKTPRQGSAEVPIDVDSLPSTTRHSIPHETRRSLGAHDTLPHPSPTEPLDHHPRNEFTLGTFEPPKGDILPDLATTMGGERNTGSEDVYDVPPSPQPSTQPELHNAKRPPDAEQTEEARQSKRLRTELDRPPPQPEQPVEIDTGSSSAIEVFPFHDWRATAWGPRLRAQVTPVDRGNYVNWDSVSSLSSPESDSEPRVTVESDVLMDAPPTSQSDARAFPKDPPPRKPDTRQNAEETVGRDPEGHYEEESRHANSMQDIQILSSLTRAPSPSAELAAELQSQVVSEPVSKPTPIPITEPLTESEPVLEAATDNPESIPEQGHDIPHETPIIPKPISPAQSRPVTEVASVHTRDHRFLVLKIPKSAPIANMDGEHTSPCESPKPVKPRLPNFKFLFSCNVSPKRNVMVDLKGTWRQKTFQELKELLPIVGDFHSLKFTLDGPDDMGAVDSVPFGDESRFQVMKKRFHKMIRSSLESERGSDLESPLYFEVLIEPIRGDKQRVGHRGDGGEDDEEVDY
ncbi:hypothetical protein G7046_g1151 [Stylonectria norvegica]|nr:hypothetical protein G7046_g1151 [Stylonectria norvegica]